MEIKCENQLSDLLGILSSNFRIIEKKETENRVLKEVFGIEKVIFNIPATVVLWSDGTKTVVKSGDYDVFDPEKGLAMAIAKKALGNKGSYYDIFKEWLPEEEFGYLCDRIKLNQAIDECFGRPEDTFGMTVTSDEFEEVKEPEIQWLSPKEVAETNGLSVECVRKQIKNGFIPLAEKVNGKWKIPCYVFDDHVEVKCM